MPLVASTCGGEPTATTSERAVAFFGGGGGGVGIRQVPGPLQRVRKGLGPRRLRTLAITGGGRICDGQLLAGGGKASWEAFMGSGKNCGGTTWLGK